MDWKRTARLYGGRARTSGVKFLAAPRIVAAKRQQVICALTPAKAPTLRRKPRPGEPA